MVNSTPNSRKLLLVNNGYPDAQNTARCPYLGRIHERLAGAGFEVTVLSLKLADNRLMHVLAYACYWIQLFSQTRSQEYDVIYAHHVNTIAPVLLFNRNRYNSLWVHWHGSELRNTSLLLGCLNWISLMIMRRIRAIHIAPSVYFAQRVAQALERKDATIHISPSGGIDSYRVSKTDNRQAKKIYRIGFAGHLNETKGFPAVCGLIKRLVSLENTLGTPVEFHLIEHKKNHGLLLPGNVIWHAPYPSSEMSKYFGHIDVLVSPSQSESLGLTALESVTHHCPVIAPDCFAFGEFIRHGVNGLLYEPGNQDALYKAVLLAATSRFSFPSDGLSNYSAESVERFYATL